MNHDDFEKKLSGTPLRKIPVAWREEILQYAAQPQQGAPMPAAPSAPTPMPAPAPPRKGSWRDLLWPCPQAWAALAAIWLGIFISNIHIHSAQTPQVAKTATEPLIMRLAQERTFTENQGDGL